MSKKNLSRTAIEGGRRGSSKYDRRQSSRDLRAANRDYKSKIKTAEDGEEAPPAPVRQPVYKEFNDKLGPVYRWIDSQVGRVWDEVFSEICTKYDTRNLASRHIVYDHILGEIHGTGFRHFSFLSKENHRWYIDDSGVLQRGRRGRYVTYYSKGNEEYLAEWKKRADQFHREKVSQLVGQKRIMRHGQKYFWAVPYFKNTFVPATPFREAQEIQVFDHWIKADRVSPADKRFIFSRGADVVRDYVVDDVKSYWKK